ncbi:conserved hypothetical protein [Candida dubliniensis CD36]|uniref:Uncharacterized protein n=1 Tax=Candida dubliniensis (strain CD36 / ATCC MYA-646 / CBS 7987 / NCPF 3949 / NRRL Y-17841) TaxID=573826 RepID=B9WHZ2_CANDC|nr:conserved hypothetical protein [Candida dubliniensis CD36]CAX41788.1 conserved hypothetical protein [Candida dubliniensis CD36]
MNGSLENRYFKTSNTSLRDNYRRRFLLGHELYIRLCLLDDIFTYEILDIGTVADIHCKLKKYFTNYREIQFFTIISFDSTIDIILRKYLEFFKVIKPVQNKNNYAYTNDESVISIPYLLGDHIRSLVLVGDMYLECVLNTACYRNFNVNLYMV